MIYPFNFVFPNWRKGSALSRVFRVIFEFKHLKKILGILIVFSISLSGFYSPILGSINDVQAVNDQEIIIFSPQPIITTQETFQKPVIGEISQGYHWYHQGIDIAGNDNAKVFPVANGKVKEIGYQLFGYGNYVIVNHGEEVASLYGHLKTIKVGPNQEVKKDTVLGIVGSTGRSSGPHLHLEIIINQKRVNPLSIITNF